ncbi:hypothetical protein ACFXPJ_42140, partial [Streptomyces goshikiensis]
RHHLHPSPPPPSPPAHARPLNTAHSRPPAARFASHDPDRLTAMAGYFTLYSGWRPERPAAPTLFVRAGEPLPGTAPAPAWPLPHTEITVPGDHFTLLEGHARSTARTVHDWLSELPHQ